MGGDHHEKGKNVKEMVRKRKEIKKQARKLLERHGQVMKNIQDFKMPKALASWFLLKYIKLYKVCYKLDPNVYTLLLPTTFVAHSTFHVSKLKRFNEDKRRLNKKQA